MIDRRLLIVGEDFGRSDKRYHLDAYALTGRSGQTLADWAGMPRLRFYVSTLRTNVVELPEDWKDPTKVIGGVMRISELMHGRRTILLGSRVATAFGMKAYDGFTWNTILRDCRVARMPHPSGRNLFWNDPANVARARAFLSEAMRS